jgi:hypothetical protein
MEIPMIMTLPTTPRVRLILLPIITAIALGGCAVAKPAPGDGGTPKFVADTLTAKGVRQ